MGSDMPPGPPSRSRRPAGGPRGAARGFVALLAALVLGAPSEAALRYGGDASFAPFESLDERGVAHGFQVDLVAELGRVLGTPFVVTLKPWEETEADFRAGRVDSIAMVDTASRRQWARFAKAHATPAFGVYHLRARPEPQGLHTFAGLQVAILDGEPMRDTVETLLAGLGARFAPFRDAARALAAVQHGEADVALLPRAYADPQLGTPGLPDVVAGRMNPWLQSYAFAFAPGNDALRIEVERALEVLERDGRLEALRVRWLSSHREAAARQRLEQEVTRTRRWTWELGAAAAAGLAALGGLAWLRGRRHLRERRRRQRAEAMLERAFTASELPMLVLERRTGTVRDANRALLRLIGVPPGTPQDRPLPVLAEHVDPDLLASLSALLDAQGRLAATPLRVQRRDGSARECLVSAEPVSIDGLDHVFCILRDLTETLAQDEALREGYRALQAALDASHAALASAQARQARAEGELQAFTGAVSHDLRAPLNAVRGFAGLLRDRLDAGRIDEAIDYSVRIDRAAVRMNEMITALASLARVMHAPLARQAVDMQQLAADTWALLAGAQPERRVECRVQALPAAQADPAQAAQVWQNLLDNAFKYTAKADPGRVAVDSYADARGTWYRVTDNGAGFDMARASSLFLPFRRMHADAEFAGTGLGLSLVRRIVDRHDGEIRVRSTPGVGTVVEFTLDAPPR